MVIYEIINFQNKECELIIETLDTEEGIQNYNKGVEYIISLLNKYSQINNEKLQTSPALQWLEGLSLTYSKKIRYQHEVMFYE